MGLCLKSFHIPDVDQFENQFAYEFGFKKILVCCNIISIRCRSIFKMDSYLLWISFLSLRDCLFIIRCRFVFKTILESILTHCKFDSKIISNSLRVHLTSVLGLFSEPILIICKCVFSSFLLRVSLFWICL